MDPPRPSVQCASLVETEGCVVDELTITFDVATVRGLQALAVLDNDAASSREAVARQLVMTGVLERLDALGLPWAPTPDQVDARRCRGPAPARRALSRLRDNRRLRVVAMSVVCVAVLVALGGGYIGGWRWTGFRDNEQLWDWLQLLVLPVAVATLPIWLRRADHMARARRVAYAGLVAAFAIFALIGYLVPLGWTGFSGNKLWDWLTLLLLPVTIVTVRTWSETARELRAWHRVAGAALVAAWIVTILGGYAWGWTWTGYQGNTLWDWVQLLILPIVLPTVLGPYLARLITGDVEGRMKSEREALARAN
jgi:hypothetical protein